jgi:hypothetical protein
MSQAPSRTLGATGVSVSASTPVNAALPPSEFSGASFASVASASRELVTTVAGRPKRA